MIGWIILIIFGGLTLIIAFLCMLSVRAYIEYKDKQFTATVKYLFITVYPRPEKPEKPQKKQKKQKIKKTKKQIKQQPAPDNLETPQPDTPQKPASPTEESAKKLVKDVKDANKNKLDLEMIMLLIDSAASPFKKLLHKTRVHNFEVSFIIGGDDAAKIAISYGIHSAAVGVFMVWLREAVRLKVKEVSVTADFNREETMQYFRCVVKIRLFTALVALAHFGIKVYKEKKSSK
ncbi:MAG: DUF2953 domain-containing protein [Oscillospiraceae bacterium]|nr:DUF2953 domain-containing protein [Oscillospiraceae bacterium]